MALHNFIRLNGEYDRDFGFVDNNINYVPVEASLDQPETVDCPQGFDMPSMNAVRDQMAEQLYIDIILDCGIVMDSVVPEVVHLEDMYQFSVCCI
jgi:hypothetical protein